MASRCVRRLRPSSPIVHGGGTALFLVLLWQLLVGVVVPDYESVPTPVEVLGAARIGIADNTIWPPVAHTLESLLVSWLIAVVLGVALGALIGMTRTAERLSSTSIEILRPLPAIGFIPVAVVVFGLSQQVEILVAAYAALWPVLVNTAAGIHNVPPLMRQVGQTFGFGRVDSAVRIVLPAAAPAVLTGARIALGVALVVVVAAEMVGVPSGLGYEIVAAQQAFQPGRVYLFIVLAGLMGVLLNAALVRVAALALPGMAAMERSS